MLGALELWHRDGLALADDAWAEVAAIFASISPYVAFDATENARRAALRRRASASSGT
ncbi:hypothetical protein AURDEDRAFT_115878 [Auricularia subglabra TFB-10046 SS5]|nr:hypothetical protein AURDEDRAFT_115878 [Auricularia subglabra TFB-10046 SS5]